MLKIFLEQNNYLLDNPWLCLEGNTFYKDVINQPEITTQEN